MLVLVAKKHLRKGNDIGLNKISAKDVSIFVSLKDIVHFNLTIIGKALPLYLNNQMFEPTSELLLLSAQ